MSEHSSFEAFLHIVHVSDMHCKDASAPSDIKTDRMVQWIVNALKKAPSGKGREIAESIESRWEQGLAGHDPSAHGKACEFLDWFVNHPNFGGIETWLVDTGDLSSLGDMGSLTTALSWLSDYRRILGAKQTVILHGNHDAWPGKFPIIASKQEISGHQYALRGVLPASWPQTSVSTNIPYSNSKLQLHAINSALEDRWFNTLALGHVGIDPHWSPKPFGVDQLAELAKDVKASFHSDGKTRDMRILALHHPIHYPPPKPTLQMHLRNDTQVANALINFDNYGRGKLAHLILSGHTHESYPARGALPNYATGQLYHPLADGQIQLIAGSLAQMPRAKDRAKFDAAKFIPQQFQILTFFASKKSTNKNQVLVERRIVGRPNAAGNYGFLPLPNGQGQAESILVAY